MRLNSDGELVISVEEMSMFISGSLKAAVFHNKGVLPERIVLEVPPVAWEPKTMKSLEVDYYQIEWTPPKHWWARIGKADQSDQPMDDNTTENLLDRQNSEEPTPPQKKQNTDEMMKVRPAGNQETTVTAVGLSEPKPAPKPVQTDSDIEFIDGDITEDVTLVNLSIQNAQEEVIGEELTDDNSGHERASELDRAAEAINTANSPSSEPDGQE